MEDDDDEDKTEQTVTSQTQSQSVSEEETSQGKSWTVFVVLVLIPLVIASSTLCYFYFLLQDTFKYQNQNITFINSTTQLEVDDEPLEQTTKRIIPHVPAQPNCTKLDHVLNEINTIMEALITSKQKCTPEDFHDLEKHKIAVPDNENHQVAEARGGHFVIYIAVALLVTSLVAAFLDVYRVKGKNSKNKPQLAKRCSLADLTMMRHTRRESMRRDEMDDRRPSLKLLGRKVSMSRPPLRLN